MDKHEKTILGFSGVSHFFTHFYMLLFPALLLPISRDLGLPLSEAVNLSFIMYLLYGLLATPWGLLSDRWSHKGVLAIGIGTAGVGTLLAGLSGYLEAGSGFITASFALTGIGCSAFHPAGTALLSQGIQERGKALGISGVFGNIGIAAAPISAGLLHYAVGWEIGLIILGALGIILGLSSSLAPIGIERGSDKLVVEKVEQKSVVKLFFFFAGALIFSGLMYRSFTTVLPAFLELRLGNISSYFKNGPDTPAFDTLIANIVTTGIYVIGIIGQLIGGTVADRRSLKWAYFTFFSLALPFAVALIFLRNFLIIPTAGLFVLFVLGIQPIENSLIAYLTPAKWRSVSYGIKFSLVFGVGSLAVKLISWIQRTTDNIGSVMLMIALFLGMILGVFAVFLILSRGYDIKHGRSEDG